MKRKLSKIKTIEMEIALAKHFDSRRNLIVPCVSWGMFYYTQTGLHECDLLICTKSNYLWEVEIKVTKADLIADKKKKHGHHSERIKRLYFAIPDYLKSHIEYIPERAGIIIVKYGEDGLECKEIRPARRDKGYQLKDKERLKLAHLGAMRIWTLKKNLVKKQMVLF